MKLKRIYYSPRLRMEQITLETGIASGSKVDVGGPGDEGQPDIFDQEIEEKQFDIIFNP